MLLEKMLKISEVECLKASLHDFLGFISPFKNKYINQAFKFQCNLLQVVLNGSM